jgi:hypothetical protein
MDTAAASAEQEGSDYMIVPSRTQDKKKNPLDPDTKVSLMNFHQEVKLESLHVTLILYTPPIFVKNSDRRIPVGSASLQENDTIMEAGGVWVSPKSEEAKNAGALFDPKVIPTEGSLVPADCIWSVHAYPGPPNVRSQNPKKAMVEMGQLVGRPFDEIVEHVGAPNSRQAGEEGIFACVWMEVGFLSAWTITLVFDSYGVCASVVNESAF